jgi:hypothetical protein
MSRAIYQQPVRKLRLIRARNPFGQTFTATKTGYVMLKVEPFFADGSGTFAIGYY